MSWLDVENPLLEIGGDMPVGSKVCFEVVVVVGGRGENGGQGGLLVWARHCGSGAMFAFASPWPAILPSDRKRALQTTRASEED